MLERAEVDALYQRIRNGDHYDVIGVAPDATAEVIDAEYQKLKQWLDAVSHPDRELGDYKTRVEAITSAIETAWRVVGNPRQRMRHDERERSSGSSTGSGNGAHAVAPRKDREVTRDATTEARLSHILAMLDIHLSGLLGERVRMRDVVGAAVDLKDPSRFVRSAEEYERSGQWAEAVRWWHAAALAAPSDPRPLLRAASALRRAGVSAPFEHYARVAFEDECFGGDGGVPRR